VKREWVSAWLVHGGGHSYWSARQESIIFCRWLCLSVRLSVCHKHCFFFFCFPMESSHFLPVSSPYGTLYKTLFFDFWFRPLTPKIYSPKFAQIARKPGSLSQSYSVGHGLWVNDIWARRGDPVAYRLVPLSVCHTSLQIASSFLFLDGIEPFLAVSSLCGILQNVVLPFLM